MLTQKEVKSLFRYKNGDLFWKTRFNGKKAGSLSGCGYYQIRVNNKIYRSHRLIFLYHNGYLPEIVDHINRNPIDNRIENLREATYHTNQLNRGISKNNTSGIMGVTKHRRSNKWQAQMHIAGKNKYIGSYDTLEEATSARETYYKEYVERLI